MVLLTIQLSEQLEVEIDLDGMVIFLAQIRQLQHLALCKQPAFLCCGVYVFLPWVFLYEVIDVYDNAIKSSGYFLMNENVNLNTIDDNESSASVLKKGDNNECICINLPRAQQEQDQ